MSPPTDSAGMQSARQIADTVMYEGYVLFPYRASALKNRFRWQWGVVIPAAQAALGDTEPSQAETEVLMRAAPKARLEVTARFLQIDLRQMRDAHGRPVEELLVDGDPTPTWEEGHDRTVTCDPISLERGEGSAAQAAPVTVEVGMDLAGAHRVEPAGTGRAEHTAQPITGLLRITATMLSEDASGRPIYKVGVAVANTTDWSVPRAPREEVVRRSMVGVHVLLRAQGATFASVIDPPDWALPHTDALVNHTLHPVLVCGGEQGSTPAVADDVDATDEAGGPDGPGAEQIVLAAPIILYDYPEIAPESAGQSFDATEVDELLSLCVLGLSDEERRRARVTDPRAAELIERTETLPQAVMERLHGTVRGVPAFPTGRGVVDPDQARLLGPEPGVYLDDDVIEALGVGQSPVERVRIGADDVGIGDRVRLRPRRRADAHDLFNEGRVAVVEKIVQTDDGDLQVAVTLEEDPAADLHRWYGRFQYFGIDEVDVVHDGA